MRRALKLVSQGAVVTWSHNPNRNVFSDRQPHALLFSQPSIYIDGWLYDMSITSVVCNVPVLSQNDSTYHHSVFTT